MSILGSLAWILAGGAYATKEGIKDMARSSFHIEYDEKQPNKSWYDTYWQRLDHARQRELYKMYTEDLLEFVALGCSVGQRYMYGRNDYSRTLPTDSHYGVYFKEVARGVADREGWKYDESLHLDKEESSKYKLHDYRFPTEQEKTHEIVDHIAWVEGIPWIGENNNWWINGCDTGVWATPQNFPKVSKDGTWQFGKTQTSHIASDKLLSAHDIDEPRIEGRWKSGKWRWFISFSAFMPPLKEVYTQGVDMGVDEADGYPELREDGYYWCGSKRTCINVSPVGRSYIAKQGHWYCKISYSDESREDVKWIGSSWVDTRIPVTIRRRMHTNPKREGELYALYDLAKQGSQPARGQLQKLVQREIDFNDNQSWDNSELGCVATVARREGWSPKCYGDRVGNQKIYNGRNIIQQYIEDAKAELITQYRNYPRQEELLRMLYYCQNGNKEAKRDYYNKYYDVDDEEDIDFYVNDPEQHKNDFGKDGLALDDFKEDAKKEGWIWDDAYPDALRKQQLLATYKCEVSYSDPTLLPFNHERQKDVYKAKFHATEHKSKEAQKALLLFTGTRNTQRLSDEKFFALCSDCAKEEGWAWDDLFFTPEKCREIIRECAAEETYTPIVSNQVSD